MSKDLRNSLWITTVSLFSVLLFAVNGYSKEKPYVLGADLSITGRFSFLGDPEYKTVPLVINKINNNGGINGHLLKVIIYDDGSDTTKARLNVQRLITKDHVIAIFGPSESSTSLAVVDLAKRYRIPIIAMGSSERIVTDPKTGKQRKWVFKTPQSASIVVEKIYGFMKKKGIKRIAIITSSAAFGSDGRKQLIKYAPKYGIKIVANEKYDPGDTNMSVQLTKIKGTNAQALVNWSAGPTQVIVTRQFKQFGLSKTMLLFQSHAFGSKRDIKLSGGAAEGVYLPLGKINIGWLLPANDPQKKPIMAFAKSYEKRYGVWPPSFAGHAYDAMMLLTDALKVVGPNKAKIRYYLEHKKDYIGMHGIFDFSPSDHNGLNGQTKGTALEMVVVKNGTWAIAH